MPRRGDRARHRHPAAPRQEQSRARRARRRRQDSDRRGARAAPRRRRRAARRCADTRMLARRPRVAARRHDVSRPVRGAHPRDSSPRRARRPDVVLFIDELHNLIGQGTAIGVAMDAGNMLKPALVRGDFRVIGATTNDEYERWVVRRSRARAPLSARARARAVGRRDARHPPARVERLERHHNVVITERRCARASSSPIAT